MKARTVNNVDLDKLKYEKFDGTTVVGPAKDLSGLEHAGESAES